MSDFVVCGAFRSDDGVMEEVFCNPYTGDLILNSDLQGNCIIGNVAVTDPTNMEGIDMTNIIDTLGVIGCVLTDTYILGFRSDMTVEYHNRNDLHNIEKIVPYDLDIEYEGELF